MPDPSEDPEAPNGPLFALVRYIKAILCIPLHLAHMAESMHDSRNKLSAIEKKEEAMIKDLEQTRQISTQSNLLMQHLVGATNEAKKHIVNAIEESTLNEDAYAKKCSEHCPIVHSFQKAEKHKLATEQTAKRNVQEELNMLTDIRDKLGALETYTAHLPDMRRESCQIADSTFNVKNNTDSICRALNELQDSPMNFERIMDRHPHFFTNPLDFYEHTYNNGNPIAKKIPTKAIILVHPRKTAGTTLTHIIRSNVRNIAFRKDFLRKFNPRISVVLSLFRSLPEELKKKEQEKWNQYDAFAGHGMYGVHELVSRPYAYITMLRDPAARLMSYYLYTKQIPEVAWTGEATDRKRAENLSLMGFIRDPHFKTQLLKEQSYVQLIAGTSEDTITPTVLEQAKKNLATFEAVLLTEQFDTSVALLKALYGWEDTILENGSVMPRNGKIIGDTTGSKAALQKLPPEEREALEEFLQYDRALYEYAKTLFEEQLKKYGILATQTDANQVASLQKKTVENALHKATSAALPVQ